MTTTKRPRVTVRRKPEEAYHHGDLRSALKNAALRLVRAEGAHSFSMNAASRLAGVTTGAPYRHFADKDALLADIATDGYRLLAAQLHQAATEAHSAREQILAAGLAYLEFARTHADYYAVMFQSGLEKAQYPELHAAGEQAFGVLLALAANLERTPDLALQRTLGCWALVHGLASLAEDRALPPLMQHPAALRPLLEHFLA